MVLSDQVATEPFTVEDDINLWQFPPISDRQQSLQQHLPLGQLPLHDEPDSFLNIEGASTPSSISYSHRPPEFVVLQALQTSSSSPSEDDPSPKLRTRSFDSTNYSMSMDRDNLQRCLSLAQVNLSPDETYRPRKAPARTRKNSTSRITPRSEKHARELALNRKAATKCRNRQKQFVEQLQQRCLKEQERMLFQTSMVYALHNEATALRNEVMRHSFCHWGGLEALNATNHHHNYGSSTSISA